MNKNENGITVEINYKNGVSQEKINQAKQAIQISKQTDYYPDTWEQFSNPGEGIIWKPLENVGDYSGGNETDYIRINYTGQKGIIESIRIIPHRFSYTNIMKFGTTGTKTNVIVEDVGSVHDQFKYLNDRKATGFEIRRPEKTYELRTSIPAYDNIAFNNNLLDLVPNMEHIDSNLQLSNITPDMFSKLKNLKTIKRIYIHQGKVPDNIFKKNTKLERFEGFYNLKRREQHTTTNIFANNAPISNKNTASYYNQPEEYENGMNNGW